MTRILYWMAVLLGLLMIGAGMIGAQGDHDRVHLTEDDNGGVITVNVGVPFDISLEANPSTGYAWHQLILDPTMEIIAPHGESDFVAQSDAVGSQGMMTLHFVALEPGDTTLLLSYHRSFEADIPAIATFEVSIRAIAEEDSGDTSLTDTHLEETHWIADQILGERLPNGILIDIAFAEGQISGHAACNHYFSNYTQDSGRLHIGIIGMTEMACEKSLMQLDTDFIDALAQTASYQIEGDQLTLFDANRHELMRFYHEENAMILDQTSWTVTLLNGEALPEEAQIDADFAEGRIGGRAACNRYFSSYEHEGSTISFGMVGMTMMGCSETLMQLDTKFTQALEQTTSYQIEGEQLMFLDADGGELVRFDPA